MHTRGRPSLAPSKIPAGALEFDIESISVKDEPAKLSLEARGFENDAPELKVLLSLANADEVAKINGRLLNLGTNQSSGEFDVTVTEENDVPTAYIPVDIEEDTSMIRRKSSVECCNSYILDVW